jgi:hypothetical protein
MISQPEPGVVFVNIQGTFRELRGQAYRMHEHTSWRELGNIQGTFWEHSGNIQGIFREHLGNIQGTFREHSGNIQGTFREHSGNIQGICRHALRFAFGPTVGTLRQV